FAEHGPAQGSAVERVVLDGAGKGGFDRGQGAPAARLQPVHRGVGVEDRDAGAPERIGGGGLAHADPAGKADHLHAGSGSAATKWRNASSTTGSTPNQARNPGTAW